MSGIDNLWMLINVGTLSVATCTLFNHKFRTGRWHALLLGSTALLVAVNVRSYFKRQEEQNKQRILENAWLYGLFHGFDQVWNKQGLTQVQRAEKIMCLGDGPQRMIARMRKGGNIRTILANMQTDYQRCNLDK